MWRRGLPHPSLIRDAHRGRLRTRDGVLRGAARTEADRIARTHAEQLTQEVNRAKDALRKEVGVLAVAAAEKILMNEVDAEKNKAILDHLIEEL